MLITPDNKVSFRHALPLRSIHPTYPKELLCPCVDEFGQDHFYICPGHLKDKGFASPILDPEVEAKKAADAKKQAAIAEVVAEYEAKQKKKKGKRKDKDKDKDKMEEKAEKEDDEKAEKEKNEKACANTARAVTSLTSSRSSLLRLETKLLLLRRKHLESTLCISKSPSVISISWQCVD